MAWLVRILSVFICVFLNEVLGLHSGYFPDLQEVESVKVHHTTFANRHKRSLDFNDFHKPDFHEIRTKISGLENDATFRFKPIATHQLLPITHRTSSGKLERYEPKDVKCQWIYEDVSGDAHAVVDTCDPERGFTVIAELSLNGSHHVILPKEDSTGSIEHALFAVNTEVDFLDDYAVFDDDLQTKEEDPIRKKRGTGSTTYTVEFMIVLDYTVYNYWFRMTSAAKTTVERDTEAMTVMQTFYSFIARAMDYRYKRISGLTIGLELNEIYVLKSIAFSSITVQPGHVEGIKDKIDVVETLDKFIAWVAFERENEEGFINTDHYMLFTNQDLSLEGNNGAAGYAAFQGICTVRSMSIVEGGFHFVTAVLGAHELGHSLGGKHDGFDNTCNSEDGYVLASTNSVKTGAQKNNPFQFSTCSVASFTDLIGTMDTENRNCLIINGVAKTVTTDATEIGQSYSPDIQCQRVFGSSSTMWRFNNLDKTSNNFNNICTGMTCITGTRGQFMIPADGTSCGSGKWCQNGECVASSNAPAGRDECFFGDQPGEVSLNITCVSLLAAHLGKCYEETIRHQCCASCEAQKIAIEGCTYGDKNDCSNIQEYNCYQDSIPTTCCKTCKEYSDKHTHLPADCKYGDKSTGCTISQCRANKEICCETCSSATPAPTQATGDSTAAPGGGTTAVPSNNTTTEPEESSIPDWAIPVAGAAGGLVALGLLGLLAYYLYTRRKSGSKRYKRRDNRRSKDKRRHNRGHERSRSPERRYDPYGGRDFNRY